MLVSRRPARLCFDGEIDLLSLALFEQGLAWAADAQPQSLVDLTEVTFISCHGIGILSRHCGELVSAVVRVGGVGRPGTRRRWLADDLRGRRRRA